ncbi:MAG TPA: hypothetical protein VGV61_02890, partial [Thermoanaerobaculia bacterium]|nr:hypothetical protein [Thermoanaerobaculia bacterium]
MEKLRSVLVAAACAALAVPQVAAATPPGGHLAITEVSVDTATSTIVIRGTDLGFGPRFSVSLGQLGSITPLCTRQLAPPQSITCDFTAVGGLPPAGDYLLTVAAGNGQSQQAEYDLTLGAAGAPGPPGPPG